jgi:hypothetical protein
VVPVTTNILDKLPIGKYYLVETTEPTGHTGNLGKVFVLSVTDDGTMQKELGKTVEGDPGSGGTLLTEKTGSTESVKKFVAEGTKDLVTVFKEWIVANPPTSSGGTDPSGTP